jgi:hypothetical protein
MKFCDWAVKNDQVISLNFIDNKVILVRDGIINHRNHMHGP